MNVGSLFSGGGLFDLGLSLAGIEHRWLCEIDPFRRVILGRRWPGVRIFDDVRAVGIATAEPVTVIAGGFPCKGASTGGKREGFDHPETRLWREMARAIGELRPQYVVVENVANIIALHGGELWGEVLGTLATERYDVQWDCIPAAAFGATHLRDRVLAIAEDTDQRSLESGWLRRRERETDQAAPADSDGACGERLCGLGGESRRWPDLGRGPAETASHADGITLRQQPESESWRYGAPVARGVAVEWGDYGPAIARWESVHGRAPEPLVRRVDDGRAAWVERSRLSALGDGVQVQLGRMVGEHLMRLEASS